MVRTKFASEIHSATEKKMPTLLVVVKDEEDKDKTISSDTREYTFNELTEGMSTADKADLLKLQAEIQPRLITIKKSSYEIGKLLSKAKQKLPFGKFMPWIRMTFGDDLPYGTAYLYMKIYEVFKDSPDTVRTIPMKCLANFTQKDFPAEIINILKENTTALNKAGLMEVNNAYGLMKSGTLGNDQFLQIAKKEIKDAMNIEKGRTKHRVNRNMRQPLYCGIEELVKYINTWRVTAEKMGWLYPHDPSSKESHKVNSLLDQAIDELRELKTALNGGRGLIRPISTTDGDKLI